MLDNNLYNLLEQLAEESQSLHRIKNSYRNDAKECSDCMDFWDRMEKDKEEHIQDLMKLIKEHM